MIINIKHKKDLITLDLRIKQIRYLEDYKQRGFIHFIDISRDDIDSYLYLYNTDLKIFKRVIKEDIKSFINKDINTLNLKICKGGFY